MGKFAVIVEKSAQKELLAHYRSGDSEPLQRPRQGRPCEDTKQSVPRISEEFE